MRNVPALAVLLLSMPVVAVLAQQNVERTTPIASIGGCTEHAIDDAIDAAPVVATSGTFIANVQQLINTYNGARVVVQRVDDSSLNDTSTPCPASLSLVHACFSSLNLALIGPNTFAAQPPSQRVVAKLAGDDCAVHVCPLGWAVLRLTRAMEAVGEFVPDLVGSFFDLADGKMAASFVASATGDEINPFAALRVHFMGETGDSCTVRQWLMFVLHKTPPTEQAMYESPDLGDVFDVATSDVVMDTASLVQSYGN